MSKFLITGLPRSRTAWLSVVATGRNSYCYHEPLKDTTCFDDLAEFLEGDLPFTGISDSGVVPQLGRILAEIEPRTLIVQRPVDDVVRSFLAYMPMADLQAAMNYVVKSQIQLSKFIRHPLVRLVDYKDLADGQEVQSCMSWLMPGNEIEFDRKLMGMNIQVEQRQALEDMNIPHNRWYDT